MAPANLQVVPAAGIEPTRDDVLRGEAEKWIRLAQHFKIQDIADYEVASFHLQAIKELQSQADDTFDSIIRKAHEAHAEAIKQKRRITDPLVTAEKLFKSHMGAWIEERQRLEREETARRQAEAERLAAEQREQEILEAERAGATVEEVAAIIEAPLPVAAIVPAPQAPRVNGISPRAQWRFEVEDLPKLIQYCAANPQFSNLLKPDDVAIGALVRGLKTALKIPGIKVLSGTNIAARRR